MKKKAVLLTLLEPNENLMRLLGEELSRMGLDVSGHFHTRGSDALGALVAELAQGFDLWLIAGELRSLNDPQIRRELSITALGVQAERATPLPVIISPAAQGMTPFTGPLAGAEVITGAVGAKAVAKIHQPAKQTGEPLSYRLKVHALAGLGLWIETGPPNACAEGPWKGAFLACTGEDDAGKAVTPMAHGVGLINRIPERSTLEYPVQGMKIEHGGRTWEGWGAANELTPDRAYFIKLSAIPASIMFGPFPGEDEPELFVLPLE